MRLSSLATHYGKKIMAVPGKTGRKPENKNFKDNRGFEFLMSCGTAIPFEAFLLLCDDRKGFALSHLNHEISKGWVIVI